MRHLAAVLVVASIWLAGCADDEDGAAPATPEQTLVPDSSTPAPGTCNPDEQVTTPKLTSDGTTVDATFGVGSFDCGGANGDGFVIFNYNPVLIDANGTITVDVGRDEVTATFGWDGGTPFAEASDGVFTSTLSGVGCFRLIVDLVTATGGETGTYGADVRIGGGDVECPQRELDVIDPTDTASPATGVTFDTLPDVSEPGTAATAETSAGAADTSTDPSNPAVTVDTTP